MLLRQAIGRATYESKEIAKSKVHHKLFCISLAEMDSIPTPMGRLSRGTITAYRNGALRRQLFVGAIGVEPAEASPLTWPSAYKSPRRIQSTYAGGRPRRIKNPRRRPLYADGSALGIEI